MESEEDGIWTSISSSHRSPWAFGTDSVSFPLRDTLVIWISIVLESEPEEEKKTVT